MMDMKCISHSTKNRMKPNTARPCMASSSTAMALSGGCRGCGPAGGHTGSGWRPADSECSGPTVGATSSAGRGGWSGSGSQRGTSGSSPCQELRWRDRPASAWRCWCPGHGASCGGLTVTRPADGQLTNRGSGGRHGTLGATQRGTSGRLQNKSLIETVDCRVKPPDVSAQRTWSHETPEHNQGSHGELVEYWIFNLTTQH